MHDFFQLHCDLPREGPGDLASLSRALGFADLPANARILDAGCGPGADISGLLDHCPAGHVVAVDPHKPFVDQARAIHGSHPNVSLRAARMEDAEGPFDLIWCAGALYFLGLDAGLGKLRRKLVPSGVLAFSHPCWFVDNPSDAAKAFWQGEAVSLLPERGVLEVVKAAGFEVLGAFPLPDSAWEAYYQPMEARIRELQPEASDSLAAVLEEGRQEASGWRKVRAETGYLQVVARALP